MSLYAPDDFGYLQQAEAYFLSHSKIGVMLSSKDTELLRTWREAGVPIEVVCYGIRRSFHQFKDPPRALFRCRGFVEEELKAWKERLVGEGQGQVSLPLPPSLPGKELPDPTDPTRRRRREALREGRNVDAAQATEPSAVEVLHDPLRQVPEHETYLTSWYRSMWCLMDLGRKASTAAAKDAYRWGYRKMNELRQEARVAREDREIVRRLALAIGHIEAEMYQRAYEGLSQEEQARLDQGLPTNMGEALGQMSLDAKDRQQRIWRRRLLEEALQIEPFFVP